MSERSGSRGVLGRLRDAVCRVREDVAAIRDRDPAAGGTLDVLLFYPGMTAVWTHRVAHALWRRNRRFGARALSHLVRLLTAVEIHPGAELGRRVTIDHGAGVVVGETAELGDDVHLYHGVTLGANRPQPGKRHPTVEANVVLGANSTVVGSVTVGERAVVGAGAVVTDDVPAGATMVGNPAERVDGVRAVADDDEGGAVGGAATADADGTDVGGADADGAGVDDDADSASRAPFRCS